MTKKVLFMLIAVFLFISLYAVFSLSPKMTLRNKITDKYGDSITIEEMTKSFKLSSPGNPVYIIRARSTKDNILFSINQNNLKNSYVNNYWESRMYNETSVIVKEIFGNDAWCQKIILSGSNTDSLPGEDIIPYAEYVDNYVNKRSVSIVIRADFSYPSAGNDKITELLLRLYNSEMFFYKVSVYFNDDSYMNITRNEISDIDSGFYPEIKYRKD